MSSVVQGLSSVVVAACLSLALIEGASGAVDLLAGIDAGFEGSGDGWTATNGTSVATSAAPVHGGAKSAKFTAASTGAVTVRTQWWRVTTVPGAAHSGSIWIHDNDPKVSLSVELGFTTADGVAIASALATSPVGADNAAWRAITVGPVTAPAAAAFAVLTVRGTATGAGATFAVDDATLVRDDPPPPPPSTSTSPAPASPAPTQTSLATTPVVPAVTMAPTATVLATPPPQRVFEALTNGGFESLSPLDGWDNTGGTLSSVSPGFDGVGRAALLVSSSDSTKWMFQTLTVEPGAWYTARASVRLAGEASAAWLRVAWYASTDGSGSQLALADSNLVTTFEAPGTAHLVAAQAPSTARSARVRVMLRPIGGAPASVTVDDVRFDRGAPPARTPVATPRPLPTPAATAPVAAVRGADAAAPPRESVGAEMQPAQAAQTPRSAAAPRVEPPLQRVDGSSPRAVVNGPLLRITEFMSDAPEPGADQDFEWIEIANLGTTPAALGGLLLGDNAGAVELPPVTLAGGRVLVVAGARAQVPEADAWSPAEGFSNGLGNAGDRLVLFNRDGGILDALSYGSDTTYDRPALPAPAAGKSLVRRFADDGSFASAEVSAAPSPGVLATPEPRTLDPSRSTAAAASSVDPLAWIALSLIGTGALGAAAVQRYRVVRGRNGP